MAIGAPRTPPPELLSICGWAWLGPNAAIRDWMASVSIRDSKTVWAECAHGGHLVPFPLALEVLSPQSRGKRPSQEAGRTSALKVWMAKHLQCVTGSDLGFLWPERPMASSSMNKWMSQLVVGHRRGTSVPWNLLTLRPAVPQAQNPNVAKLQVQLPGY